MYFKESEIEYVSKKFGLSTRKAKDFMYKMLKNGEIKINAQQKKEGNS